MQIENETIVKMNEEDSILFVKLSYLVSMYSYYWNYSHEAKFLYKYQENLAKLLKFNDIYLNKYMKKSSYIRYVHSFSNNILFVEFKGDKNVKK